MKFNDAQKVQLSQKASTFVSAIINHIVGYRSRNKRKMIIASLYYAVCLLFAIMSGAKTFLFGLVLTYSPPFLVFSIIDSAKTREIKWIAPFVITFVLLIITSQLNPILREINIGTDAIIFSDIGESQTIDYTLTPSDCNVDISFVSENTEIASFDGNVLTAHAEGETAIYALSGNIESEHVSVTVHDIEAESQRNAQVIVDMINSIQNVTLDSQSVIVEAEKLYSDADDITKAKVSNIAVLFAAREEYNKLQRAKEEQERIAAEKLAEQERLEKEEQERIAAKQAKAAEQEVKKNTTVYIGKTGTKYHHSSCSTLKGKGFPISLAAAESRGYTPCKRCY